MKCFKTKITYKFQFNKMPEHHKLQLSWTLNIKTPKFRPNQTEIFFIVERNAKEKVHYAYSIRSL